MTNPIACVPFVVTCHHHRMPPALSGKNNEWHHLHHAFGHDSLPFWLAAHEKQLAIQAQTQQK